MSKILNDLTEQQNGAFGNLTEAQFFDNLRSIESAERQKDAAVAALRTSRKRAKEANVSLYEFDLVRKLAKFTRAELVDLFNRVIAYSKWLRTPLIGQLDLFSPTEPTEQELHDDAYGRGVAAGRRGLADDSNPWPLETPLGQSYQRGLVDGRKLAEQDRAAA